MRNKIKEAGGVSHRRWYTFSMNLVTLNTVFAVVKGALPVVTVLLAFLGGHAAAKINRKNKIADVVMHCMVRYDAIAHDKATIDSREKALYYFRRYFGLKSDQFDYWLSGLIDAENILSWFYSILSAFETGKSVTYTIGNKQERITFEQGWNEVRESHVAQDTTFVRTIERIRQIALQDGEAKNKYYLLVDLFEEVERYEKDFIRFTEVNFIFTRIRGGNIASFRKMERRLRKKRQENSNFHLTTLD
jgi:hypothetical protein